MRGSSNAAREPTARPRARRAAACALCVAAVAGLAGCASRGRELFVREGCVSCHHFRGLGPSGGAPDLSDVASRRTAASIREQITNPGGGDPASRMPPFRDLSWFDLQSLVAFLRS